MSSVPAIHLEGKYYICATGAHRGQRTLPESNRFKLAEPSCEWSRQEVLSNCILCVYVCSVAHSCLTLCDPMDCIPPGYIYNLDMKKIFCVSQDYFDFHSILAMTFTLSRLQNMSSCFMYCHHDLVLAFLGFLFLNISPCYPGPLLSQSCQLSPA